MVEYIPWTLLVIAAFYLGVPLFIRFQQWLAAHPKFLVLDFDQLRPSVAQFLMARTRDVVELGFAEPTLVQMPDAAPQVTAYLIMLVNRETGDKAMVTVMIGQSFPLHLQVSYVEFSTRFETGEMFDTLNSPEVLAFPPGPTSVRTQVPALNDPRQLYRLHTFVMNKQGFSGKKVLYEPGQALDYFVHNDHIGTCEEQVERGWLYYDEGRDTYRYTFKGAYWVTWGLMQPFKALRKIALGKRARKILREFEQTGASE